MNPSDPRFLGVAMEDIPAGSAVELDLANGKIRRTTTPVDVHLVTIQLRISSTADGKALTAGAVVCSCDVGRPLVYLNDETSWEKASEAVTAHLERHRAEQPARLHRDAYRVHLLDGLLNGRRVVVALPDHQTVQDELHELDQFLRAEGIGEEITTRRTNGAQGFRSRSGGSVDLLSIDASMGRAARLEHVEIVYVPEYPWARTGSQSRLDQVNEYTGRVRASGGRVVWVEGR